MAQVRLLQQQHINRALWDKCVTEAYNTLPYAYSWYLDAVAQNWDGLVYGEYEAVMPLVWLRKLGFKCLYQPYYCQQLGVFSIKPLGEGELALFMKQALAYAPYTEVNLNPAHRPNKQGFGLIERKNLLLDLSKPYAELRSNFTENHRRNMAKAVRAGLQLARVEQPEVLQHFYLANVNRDTENITAESEAIFVKLIHELFTRGKAITYGAYMHHEMVAAVLLVPHGNRLISIINSSSSTGKAKGASHFVYAGIIEHYAANAGYVLDFEGSSIAGIARFYEGFGARQETFYRWKTHLAGRISQRFM